MAFTSLPGTGFTYPTLPTFTLTPSLSTALVTAATGDKIAWMGRVFIPGSTGSKNISRVGFRFGTVVKAGGSGLTVSLQDVSLTSGPPWQPDETQDQTVAIANDDSGFTSNSWYRTNTFNATRTVNHGDLLAVVIEYDGSGRLGSDSVIVNGLTKGSVTQWPSNTQCASFTKTSGTWTDQLSIPNVILEFDDGTFGTLDGAHIASALNTHIVNTGTTPDEVATAFTVPFKCQADGLWLVVNMSSASGDYDLVLYEDTTALTTVTIDSNAIVSDSTRTIFVPIPKVTLNTGTTYYVAHKSNTGNNSRLYSTDVSDANHLSVMSAGTSAYFASRTDADAWTPTTTRRLFAGVRICAIDFPASAHNSLFV